MTPGSFYEREIFEIGITRLRTERCDLSGTVSQGSVQVSGQAQGRTVGAGKPVELIVRRIKLRACYQLKASVLSR